MPIAFLFGLKEQFTSQFLLRNFNSTQKFSIGRDSTFKRFYGMSSLTYNMIPSPEELRSIL